MTGVDTNVIVRFLVRDHREQAEAVYLRLKKAEKDKEAIFVPILVTLETIWVLQCAYGKTRPEILDSIRDMRQMPVFEFEADSVIENFLEEGYRSKTDLADILIVCSAKANGCEDFVTFDKAAAKLPGVSLLKC